MTNFGQQNPPQQYGQPQPQHGAPQPQQQWTAPAQPFPQPGDQQQHGQQQYGQQQHGQPSGRSQQYGQQYGQPQQYGQQPYGAPQVPWGVAPPQQQYDARAQDRKAAVKQMAIGGVVALVGLIITVVTYKAASGGGHYVVAWGPAIFGAIAFVRGLVAYLKA